MRAAPRKQIAALGAARSFAEAPSHEVCENPAVEPSTRWAFSEQHPQTASTPHAFSEHHPRTSTTAQQCRAEAHRP